MRMGDMGPRGAINMGGRDLKLKALVGENFETVHITHEQCNILATNRPGKLINSLHFAFIGF